MRMIVITGLLIAAATTTVAQVDTSKNVFQPNKQRPLSNRAIENARPIQPPTQYRLEDRIIIRHDELPNGLRESLMNNTYKGWENSVIYKDRLSGEFYYQVNPADTTRASRIYRFDRNGKAIPDQSQRKDDQ